MTLHNDTPPEDGNELATGQNEPLQINSLIFPLYQSLFWVRLFAACLVFYGALITVTGIGVLVAWIPIWIGMLLLLAAKAISLAYKENDEQAFMQFISRLKTIFTILGFTSVAMIVASLYLLNYAIDKSLF
jgi:hypothetical protein